METLKTWYVVTVCAGALFLIFYPVGNRTEPMVRYFARFTGIALLLTMIVRVSLLYCLTHYWADNFSTAHDTRTLNMLKYSGSGFVVGLLVALLAVVCLTRRIKK
ncbi:MAG: hypothetical protein LBK71_10285 [Verrucomicrobiales bacterium]|nr:hypothetical protein [Verrucomicrobiales bacterium]